MSRAKWNEPLLLDYEFRFGSQRRKGRARVGLPRLGKHEWECSFQLHGVKDGRVRVAYGIDGVQALILAVTALRGWLDGLKTVEAPSEPYEFVLPRTLPIGYGLDFHRSLCQLVDKKIKAKERLLTHRRVTKRKPRQ